MEFIKTRTVLGEGASAIVYKGYNKKTGEAVAIKQYTKAATKKLKDRETTTLLTLEKHENIIHFLECKFLFVLLL